MASRIATPKCLYFTAVVSTFFFLFLMPNLWGYWTDLNQTWTHIDLGLWLLFERFGPNSLTGWGAKTAFGDQIWTLTEHISTAEHDINNRKETCQCYIHAPKFSEIWSRNNWERLASFCPSLYIFCIVGDTASLTTWTLYNKPQANFGTCSVVHELTE